MDPAQQFMAELPWDSGGGRWTRGGFGRGLLRSRFPQGRAIAEQVCTHLVDETGELRVEGLDLLLLLAANLVFQRVHPDTEGFQQPLVDADALDAVSLALGVAPDDAVPAGATQAHPSSSKVPIAHPCHPHVPKAAGGTAPVDIGDPPAASQVADAPAAVGPGAAARGLPDGRGVAAATNLRGRAETSSSQHRSHCRRLPAHRGFSEGGMAKLRGCSGAGEEQGSHWSDAGMLSLIYILGSWP